jgi:hypothetical protein
MKGSIHGFRAGLGRLLYAQVRIWIPHFSKVVACVSILGVAGLGYVLGLLVCAVILAKAGTVGQDVVKAVQVILRNTWRASSPVESINSVLRMQQARRRKMRQGLLDLKRLYWNSHAFCTGRRRGKTPYGLLGVSWPEGLRWWDLLKWRSDNWEKTVPWVAHRHYKRSIER